MSSGGIADASEIGAGAEMAAGPPQNRHPQRLVGLESVEGLAQFGRHRAIDRVAHGRPVQHDRADGAIDLGPDE